MWDDAFGGKLLGLASRYGNPSMRTVRTYSHAFLLQQGHILCT